MGTDPGPGVTPACGSGRSAGAACSLLAHGPLLHTEIPGRNFKAVHAKGKTRLCLWTHPGCRVYTLPIGVTAPVAGRPRPCRVCVPLEARRGGVGMPLATFTKGTLRSLGLSVGGIPVTLFSKRIFKSETWAKLAGTFSGQRSDTSDLIPCVAGRCVAGWHSRIGAEGWAWTAGGQARGTEQESPSGRCAAPGEATAALSEHAGCRGARSLRLLGPRTHGPWRPAGALA